MGERENGRMDDTKKNGSSSTPILPVSHSPFPSFAHFPFYPFRHFLFFALFVVSPSWAQDTSRRSPVVIAVEKASPAVVSIVSSQEVEQPANPFRGNPFFEDFFRDFFESSPERRTDRSLGSGVVIRPDGYILTNEHVVQQSGKVQIQLANERKLNARLIGADS